MRIICGLVGAVLLAGWVGVRAQAPADAIAYPAAHGEQTETDEYTRYELLGPETASFKIYYEVTATTAGAKYFYNPIRKGSVATDESVLDAMSGKPLQFEVVHGPDARKDPLMPKADVDTDYIKVTLARAVPARHRNSRPLRRCSGLAAFGKRAPPQESLSFRRDRGS